MSPLNLFRSLKANRRSSKRRRQRAASKRRRAYSMSGRNGRWWLASRSNPPQEPLRLDWQAVDAPFSEFEYVGTGPAPADMLSSALGQLRLVTAPETNPYIDDVEPR